MDAHLLEGYLKQVQQLASQLDCEPGALQVLLHYIESSKDAWCEDPAAQEFLMGEYAFYSAYYERALKHYLQAKGIPFFEFFCYRASAQVSKNQQDFTKAKVFISKALELVPDDYASLLLLAHLCHESGSLDESQAILAKLHALTASASTVKTDAFHPHRPAHLSQKTIHANEIKELVELFSMSGAEDDLFAVVPGLAAKASCASVKVDLFVIEEEGCNKGPQAELCNAYLQRWRKRPSLPDYTLHVLHGWEESAVMASSCAAGHLLADLTPENIWSLLSEKVHLPSGGFYLRWNGRGIAINPGKNFLKNFHHAGLFLRDIDDIIVTHAHPDSYVDVKEIFDLTSQLNQVSHTQCAIQYYLHQKAYQALAPYLKPRFKQERHVVHALELFMDSDSETFILNSDISLHYFLLAAPTAAPISSHALPAQSLFADQTQGSAFNLGIKLVLAANAATQAEDEKKSFSLGYISAAPLPLGARQHLADCDLLLVGMGDVNVADPSPLAHAEAGQGYASLLTLIKELAPKCLLCTEFSGREGDRRLELVRNMRRELALSANPTQTAITILPADKALLMDLKQGKVKCSLSGEFTDAKDILVIQPSTLFGQLRYLSPKCFL